MSPPSPPPSPPPPTPPPTPRWGSTHISANKTLASLLDQLSYSRPPWLYRCLTTSGGPCVGACASYPSAHRICVMSKTPSPGLQGPQSMGDFGEQRFPSAPPGWRTSGRPPATTQAWSRPTGGRPGRPGEDGRQGGPGRRTSSEDMLVWVPMPPQRKLSNAPALACARGSRRAWDDTRTTLTSRTSCWAWRRPPRGTASVSLAGTLLFVGCAICRLSKWQVSLFHLEAAVGKGGYRYCWDHTMPSRRSPYLSSHSRISH